MRQIYVSVKDAHYNCEIQIYQQISLPIKPAQQMPVCMIINILHYLFSGLFKKLLQTDRWTAILSVPNNVQHENRDQGCHCGTETYTSVSRLFVICDL